MNFTSFFYYRFSYASEISEAITVPAWAAEFVESQSDGVISVPSNALKTE